MKPIWKNGRLTVELHKPDIKTLEKAREIGRALEAMNQDAGTPLVSALDEILETAPEVE